MTTQELRDRVVAVLPGAEAAPAEHVRGQTVVVIQRVTLPDAFATLREHPELSFEHLSDLTAVDYLGRTPRFEVVYQLYSISLNHRLRLKVPLGEDDLTIPTASGVWKSALWAERETFDMFGIRFVGHPDLRRILMYPEFEGYPLRKDYPLLRRQPLVPERDPIANPWYPRNGAPR
jgi:NADH-quinone oxidoreductase subunit C